MKLTLLHPLSFGYGLNDAIGLTSENKKGLFLKRKAALYLKTGFKPPSAGRKTEPCCPITQDVSNIRPQKNLRFTADMPVDACPTFLTKD